MKKIIYLDNSATTRVYSEVIKEMKKYFLDEYGNPGSSHEFGEKAQFAINNARKKFAREIGAKPYEIVFTSGGTESNNLALFGVANSNKTKKKKIIISAIEHSSVFEPALELRKKGYDVVIISVNNEGILKINELEKAIDGNTLLVSIIHGNNEIGVLQDLNRIGKICKENNAIFHTDAVQSFARERIDVGGMNISLLSASAHKIGGPKGAGFLFIREGVDVLPLIFGGKQEKGIRGGTENVSGILGFAKALEITKKVNKNKMREIRDYFIEKLEKIKGKINGSKDKRLFNNINVYFSGIDAEKFVFLLSQKGIYCSTKSACLSKQHIESRVLKSIGLSKKEIKESLRFALNENISKKDIDYVIREIKSTINLKG